MTCSDAQNACDDAQLLQRYAAGEAQAAEHLTRRTAPIVFRHAVRMLANQADAEDVTQDVMIKLWKAAARFDTKNAKLTTWLYRVTANLCIDHLRKRQNHSDEMSQIPDESPSVISQMQSQARANALQMGLMSLPERQRQAVILRHIEDLSQSQIAHIMETSEEAVESLLSRAKKGLKKALYQKQQELGRIDEYS